MTTKVAAVRRRRAPMRAWGVVFAAWLAAGVAVGADETPLQRMEREVMADTTNATLRYILAAYRERAGDRAGCLVELARARAIGEGFLPTADVFPELAKAACWDSVRASFAADLPRVADAPVWARIPDRELLPEGIAWDSRRDAWYVGSVARRAVYRLRPDGALEPFSRASDSLMRVLGLAVDARARRLYVVSMGGWTTAERAAPRNELVIYDLDRGVLARRIDVPGARGLNDVAVLPNGDALLSDSRGEGLWRVSLASGEVKPLIEPGGARGANGVALSPEGTVAFVAGSRGVLRVDLASGARSMLRLPPRQSVALIDGLYWYEGSLLGIQNITTPARVVRIRLNADRTEATSVETLQSHHHPEFDEPTTGAVSRGAFHVLATTQVSRFNAEGAIDRPESLKPPVVLRIPLRR